MRSEDYLLYIYVCVRVLVCLCECASLFFCENCVYYYNKETKKQNRETSKYNKYNTRHARIIFASAR